MHTPLKVLEKQKEEMYTQQLACRSIPIVPKEYKITRFLTDSSSVEEVAKTVHGQKVPLRGMMEAVLLQLKNQQLLAVQHYDPSTMSTEQVHHRLTQLHQVCAR